MKRDMEYLPIALSVSSLVASAVAIIMAHFRIKVAEERCSSLQERLGVITGSTGEALKLYDSAIESLTSSILLMDKRVQTTIDDPIMALDEQGHLVLYDGPRGSHPNLSGDEQP